MYEEQDALEILRHVSEILNKLYSLPPLISYTIKCPSCNITYSVTVNIKNYYLGNKIEFQCIRCGMLIPLVIGSEWGIPTI